MGQGRLPRVCAYELQIQKMTMAARMMALRKMSSQRSSRVAMYEDQKTVQWTVFPTIGQSFRRPKAFSMRYRFR